MKRKLNDNYMPEEEVQKVKATKTDEASFEGFGLDPRILQGIESQRFAKPTPVQSKAIPLALHGKDILGMIVRVCLLKTS